MPQTIVAINDDAAFLNLQIVCSADQKQLNQRAAYLRSKGCEILPKPSNLDDLLAMIDHLIESVNPRNMANAG